MATAAHKKERSALSRQKKAVLERILKLRPRQQERFLELCNLFRNADNNEDMQEISDALEEILFGPDSRLKGSVLEENGTDAGLEKHRAYVGQKIRTHRQRLHMTQEELGKKAGLPQTHICRLETGKHAPSYLTIERIAKALNVRMSDLDPGFSD